ncbi:MAG TPA: SDR family NAD(P)-dependent oxidoreductase, partial [Microbacterium sp.]|nr:SDR family NAD(P)-dependent oxidoreductase [Microbacterium sp.]
LADALPSRPSRVLFVSSTRVLEGRAGPRPLTESDAPSPTSARARALVEGEELAARLFDACIIRPAGIYGPGRDSVIRRVRAHAPVDYSRRTNRIHELDLVGLLHTMLRADDPPALIHAVDQAPVPMRDVVTFIADRLGLEPPPRVTPESGGGTVLRGDVMLDVVGALNYPSFREGYARMLDEAV